LEMTAIHQNDEDGCIKGPHASGMKRRHRCFGAIFPAAWRDRK
jgi:hypothetical protein